MSTDAKTQPKRGGPWGVGHPVTAVLDQAMREQPQMSMIGTYQPPQRVERYGPDRAMRFPIAENAMLGMAVGMALTGRRVVVGVARVAFLYSAMDPLVNQATKWRYCSDGQFSVPLVVRAVTRGGENLGGQHEHVPHAQLSQIPGLVVAVPSSPNSVAGLMATALRHPDPVVLLESPHLFTPGWSERPETEATPDPIPFGVAKLVRGGGDLTLVGIGNTVALCLRAADQLAGLRYRCQVVDLRTAAPLDRDGVAEMARHTGAAVLVDEASRPCSLVGDLGFHLVASGAVPADRIYAITGASCPMPASPTLQAALLPRVADVVRAAAAVLDGGSPDRAHYLAEGGAAAVLDGVTGPR